MMTKLEYLRLCFKLRCYQKKVWMLSVFSKLADDEPTNRILKEVPYSLHRDDEGYYFYDQSGAVERVEGDLAGPFAYKDERITIDESFDPRVAEPLETTLGILLVNRVVFYEAIGDSVPYENKQMGPGYVKGVIKRIMVNNPPPETDPEEYEVPAGKATVDQCLKITKQFNYLLGLNNVFCKAASIQALTVDKRILERKAELLKAHPEALTDPIRASAIIDELVAMDMKIQLEGESKDFFINKKFIDNARKRMFLAFGVEQDWNTGEYKFLHKSLDDGWDVDELHNYINTAIAGSYDRGKATGEGGAAVKDVQRLTSRMTISEDDCGTTVQEMVVMTSDQVGMWTGCYYVDKTGNLKRWEGTERHLVDTVVMMRTPNTCVTSDGNYCKACCGEALAASKDAISMECSDIATNFMLQKMRGMHVSGLSVQNYELSDLFE